MQQPTSCLELLAAMIGHDTVNAKLSGRTDPERPLCVYLEGVAKGWGLTTQRLPVSGEGFNLRVTCGAGDDAPHLLLVSHLDTVGVDGMTVEPFGGQVRGGRIYGRGACDTKGSGAAMLWALKEYAHGPPRNGRASVVFTLDEEISKDGIHALVESHLREFESPPAAAIVGEPTGLRQVVAHGGVVRWTIRARGLAAHSSDPSNGRSAISMMVRVIDAVESRYIPRLSASHPLAGRARCSINQVHGGTSVNMIPAECVIRIDRRVVPGEDCRAVLPAVEKVLDDLRREHPGIDVVQEEPFIDPPLDPARHEGFIALCSTVLEGLGLPGDPIGVPFSTEASDLGRVGIPTIVLGPGDIRAAHTADESLEVSQLDRATEVYLALMRHPLEARV